MLNYLQLTNDSAQANGDERMKQYTALVTYKPSGETKTMSSAYPTAAAFAADLRSNEYTVHRVQRSDVYEYNVQHAADEYDWLTAAQFDAMQSK
jgi:hypothetical protein